MRLILLFAFFINLSVSAQQFSTVPDSVDFVEAGDQISIFKGELTFGKTYTRLYFEGEGLDELSIRLNNGGDVEKAEATNQKKIDYLAYPEWMIIYGERRYQVEVELIQVDFPGNEINWRMIPRIHFIPAE